MLLIDMFCSILRGKGDQVSGSRSRQYLKLHLMLAPLYLAGKLFRIAYHHEGRCHTCSHVNTINMHKMGPLCSANAVKLTSHEQPSSLNIMDSSRRTTQNLSPPILQNLLHRILPRLILADPKNRASNPDLQRILNRSRHWQKLRDTRRPDVAVFIYGEIVGGHSNLNAFHLLQHASTIVLIHFDACVEGEGNVDQTVPPAHDPIREFQVLLCDGVAGALGGAVDEVAASEEFVEPFAQTD